MCFLWKPGTYVDWKIQIISNARPLLTLGISILPLFALLYIFDFKMKAILYLALFTDFVQQEVLIPVKHDRSLVSHLNQFSSRKSYKAKRSTGCIWIDTYTQRHISIYSPTCSWIWDTEKTYSFWMMWGCGLHGQLWVEPWGTARSEQLSNGKPQDNLPILTPRTELHPEWEQPWIGLRWSCGCLWITKLLMAEGLCHAIFQWQISGSNNLAKGVECRGRSPGSRGQWQHGAEQCLGVSGLAVDLPWTKSDPEGPGEMATGA